MAGAAPIGANVARAGERGLGQQADPGPPDDGTLRRSLPEKGGKYGTAVPAYPFLQENTTHILHTDSPSLWSNIADTQTEEKSDHLYDLHS